MKGANTEPSDKTIIAPNKKIKIIIGINHHFLLLFKNLKNSKIIDIFDNVYSLLILFI